MQANTKVIEMNVGENLKRYRLEAKLSQAELAKAAQVPQTNLSYWERGYSCPDYYESARIASVLGVTLEQLGEEKSAG